MELEFTRMITPTSVLFYGIVPGKAAMPLGQITLPVTFGTPSNYRTEFIKFEVADFESLYHAILGRLALAVHGDTTLSIPPAQNARAQRGPLPQG
jgi:hypothetical protein